MGSVVDLQSFPLSTLVTAQKFISSIVRAHYYVKVYTCDLSLNSAHQRNDGHGTALYFLPLYINFHFCHCSPLQSFLDHHRRYISRCDC